MFRYLNYGLSAVLTYVGLKMMAEYTVHTQLFAEWTGIERFRPVVDSAHPAPNPRWNIWSPAGSNLAVIITLLAISVIASIAAQRREDRAV